MNIQDKSASELTAMAKAMDRVQAIIWFKPDGTILEANENFCKTVGYSEAEIVGKSHRMFCDSSLVNSQEYGELWSKLASGEFVAGRFPRVHKDGSKLFLRASYNPIFDDDGTVIKVVKFAIDITETMERDALILNKLDAITKALAVIEFEPDGTIRWANDNFLNAMGYSLDEVKGRHHRMFVDAGYANTAEYQHHWQRLQQGEAIIGEFQRFGKGGKEVWIQAGYTAISNAEGKVYRVLKYATDITGSKLASKHMTQGMKLLAKGDLSYRIPDSVAGEFSELRENFNATLMAIEKLVHGIVEASVMISEDAAGIADTASDLSKRCEQQAATVEETSAAMEEMSSTIQSNATNSEASAEAAKGANAHAEKGGSIVASAVEAMGKIEGGSSEMRKIISVIDSIAFQTNLLALNAGVEAARAGDAGRGFAVVASEVRALAQRASDSARDINTLIESSAKEVVEGAGLVKKTGEALEEIVTAVSIVNERIEGIFAASQGQAAGANEINQAISDIDSTTQKTAAISEESAAAASSLAQRAADLQDLVSFFKVAQAAVGGSPAAPSSDRKRTRAARPAQAPESGVKRPARAASPTSKPAPVRAVAQQKIAVNQSPSLDIDDDDAWTEF